MSAIKDCWCSCNRLREAEAKAAKWDALVRCKDCEHYFEAWGTCMRDSYVTTFYEEDGGSDESIEGMFDTEPDGFCAWGERRES